MTPARTVTHPSGIATTRRRFLTLGAALTRIWLPHQALAATPVFAEHTLFVITRNKNANAVYYDLRLDARGQLASRQRPLSVYWRMYAEDGRREGLTWLERNMAYGYEMTPRGDPLQLRLSAFPKRPVRLLCQGDGETRQFRAFTSIGGQRALLRHIKVVADESLIGPSVRYVDLAGVNPKSGKYVRERVHA